jgi:hypothetical protein
MKDQANGNGGPWWAKVVLTVGVPSFLLAFLLGAIPGLPSPFVDFKASAARLERHERTTRRLLQMTALVCEGVWQGNAEAQQRCRESVTNIIRDDVADRHEGP